MKFSMKDHEKLQKKKKIKITIQTYAKLWKNHQKQMKNYKNITKLEYFTNNQLQTKVLGK